MPVRTFAVVCPDWPVVAAGAGGVPAVVVHAGRVVSCSAPARTEGVRVGQRRREAEGLVTPLTVLKSDPARDARAFEPVVAAVASFTPRVEGVRPGVCLFPVRGPARYFGGERALTTKVAAAVDAALAELSVTGAGGALGAGGASCKVGIADGPFAALLAAERGQMVVKGATRAFLASLPVSVLDAPDLTDLLRRLGIRTLGQLGELPEEAVTGRFGAEGRRVWHLANGIDDRELQLAEPPLDLAVARELDPPAARVDAAAFAAVRLAEGLCGRLDALGLACTRVAVEIETEHGETLRRLWRADRPFNARTVVDRVRWQLEGWLAGAAGADATVAEPTGAVAVLRLVADEVLRDRGRQLSLWGERSEADRRAEQGLARVQGLLGHEAVLTAVRSGGRAPAEQVRLVPWGEQREPAASLPGAPGVSRRAARAGAARAAQVPPWPGNLPVPSPAVVPLTPLPASVLDAAGVPVCVSGRGELSSPPVSVVLGRSPSAAPPGGTPPSPGGSRPSPGGAPPIPGGAPGRPLRVEAWAGPWPVDERWWDRTAHRRRARLQVVLEGGTAHLLSLEGGRWWSEAVYD